MGPDLKSQTLPKKKTHEKSFSSLYAIYSNVFNHTHNKNIPHASNICHSISHKCKVEDDIKIKDKKLLI